MNYHKHYDRLINRARNRILEGYYERHHIIPKCMNGGNESINLVNLLPEEHFVAHLLLCKIYPDNPKLLHAVRYMSNKNNGQCYSNKSYAWVRKRFAQLNSDRLLGVKQTYAHRLRGTLSRIGRKHSEETKRKMSKSATGKKKSQIHCENISKGKKGKYLGTECYNAKLCDSIVAMIKRDIRDTTMTENQLAKFYDVGKSCIKHIKHNRTWWWVKAAPEIPNPYLTPYTFKH